MRQSNALYRLNAYLKREEASLTKYWERDVRNENAAKVWDSKNRELYGIYGELSDELEPEPIFQNLEVLSRIDQVIQELKVNQPEISSLIIHLRLNDQKGYPSYLNLE